MNTVRCPYCNRDITVTQARFNRHNVDGSPRNGAPCPLSRQRIPIKGLSNQDHADRAEVLTDLAFQVQDEDPRIVWDYLTCLDSVELQRLLMFSLAAMDIDKNVDQLWGWVKNLPQARLEAV